jgi:hypothetical protein
MTETISHKPAPQDPICVACVGDATGQPCLRCKSTRTDPDPAAPNGIIPVAS